MTEPIEQRRASLSRRECLRALAGTAAGAWAASLAACERKTQASVVAYCSVDADVAKPIFESFEKTSGIRVDAVYDTEATKTTGLVNRLLGEKDRPRADVWWSSEPLGTIRLARTGVLAPFTTVHDKEITPSGWPKELRASDKTWYAFAERRRMLVHSTTKAPKSSLPGNLHALTEPAWRDRVGIARPQFGTTRLHMAALAQQWGQERFETWIRAVKTNGVRLFDGNSAVVRAVGREEVWLGLTDNDDISSGRANGWTVAAADDFDTLAAPGDPSARPISILLRVPGTVGVIRAGPNPALATRLADFLLSKPTEDALAASVFATSRLREQRLATGDSRNAAVFHRVNLERVADAVDAAMATCDRVFG